MGTTVFVLFGLLLAATAAVLVAHVLQTATAGF